MKEVKVFAPATVANVACGFDIFGFALEQPGDQIVARLTDAPGVLIEAITGDGGKLPIHPQKNTAGVSVLKMIEHLGIKRGLELEIHKGIPLGSGLGSSGASSAASVTALNALLEYPLTPQELIPFAMEGERIACGSPHADNVAPALLGGFVLIRSYHPLDVVSIPCQLDLYCSILLPAIEIKTEEARKILPKAIPLELLVKQTGNVAGLVAGMVQGNDDLFSRSLRDEIVEPIRSTLIPGFAAIKHAALSAGAMGCSISGSGPALFALSNSSEIGINCSKEMAKACQKNGIPCQTYVSKINYQGTREVT